MSVRLDRQGIPRLSDNPELFKKAVELADTLRYYSDLLSDPTTTALEVYGFEESNLLEMFQDIYAALVTKDEEIHARLRAIDSDVVIPKGL